MTTWTVKAGEGGARLTHFIQARLNNDTSLKQIKLALDNRGCRVNGRPERFASYLVREGDVIEYTPPTKDQRAPKIEVIYEDDMLAVVNKPPFVVCEAEKGILGMRLCHRLDKETSGCLLLAKNAEAERTLMALFRLRVIKKTYHAVVDGAPKETFGVIETPINGKSAKTTWHLEKRGKKSSLLRCTPETGRTHQIRIHLASIGHPIIGDFEYGKKFSSSFFPSRILLHASALSFLHPIRHEQLSLVAPIPDEFYQALK